MSFLPQVPVPGVAGWRFLQRTAVNQQETFEKGPEIRRDIAYFEANIASVGSAADLVADRRLLKVALGAFGLEQDIDKKAWVRKVLEEGVTEPGSFALRLSEPAYRKMSEAFGFGDPGGGRIGEPGFERRIVDAYKTRAFEAAVGETNNDMRLALNFRREMAELSKGEEGASWFAVLGSKPLRAVLEKTYNLPSEFGKLDVDRQRDIMASKTSAMFGAANLTAFRDSANVDKAIDRFLAISQLESGPTFAGPGSAALTLLQAASGDPSLGLFNLLAARG